MHLTGLLQKYKFVISIILLIIIGIIFVIYSRSQDLKNATTHELVSILQDKTERYEKRRGAAKHLTIREDPSTIDIFSEELKNNKNEIAIRLHCIQGLKNIGQKEVIPPLLEALEDREEIIRTCTILALGELRDKSVLKKLISMLNNGESEPVVLALINSLEQITGKKFGKDYDQWRKWYDGLEPADR